MYNSIVGLLLLLFTVLLSYDGFLEGGWYRFKMGFSMDDLTIDVPATLGLRLLFVEVADNREPVRLEFVLVVLPLLL